MNSKKYKNCTMTQTNDADYPWIKCVEIKNRNGKTVKKKYVADFWLGRKRKQKTSDNKELLKREVEKIKYEFNEGIITPNKRKKYVLFSEFVKEYEKIHAVKMKALKRELYRLKYLSAYFGNKFISEITQYHIEAWQAEMLKSQKVSSVNRRLVTLKSIFAKAVEWGYLKDNPAKRVKKGEENERDRYLSDAELERIEKLPESRIKTFVLFAINTGLRRENIISLSWNHINWDAMTIDIPKDQMKSGRNFSLPLNDVALKILRERIKLGMGGLVLDTCNFRKEFDQLKKDAKIENLTIHDLRRTFGSHLAKNGCDIQTIADLMDHSNLEMTRKYARLSPDKKRSAVKTLNLGAKGKTSKHVLMQDGNPSESEKIEFSRN